MPAVMRPLLPSEAENLEWESLVGELKYKAEDVKRHVESRNYDEFFVAIETLQVAAHELEIRMAVEKHKKENA